MAQAGPADGDIRATLALSQAEARMGSSRTLNLPGGRQLTVSIPAGVQNGEELRLPGEGEALWQGGPVGDLILTVSIAPGNPISSPSYPDFYQNAPGSPNRPTEIGSVPSFASPASFPGSGAGMPPTSYTPPPPPQAAGYTVPAQSSDYYAFQQGQQRQEPLVLPQGETAYAAPPPYPSSQNVQQGQYYTPAPPAAPPEPRGRTRLSALIGLIFLLILLLLIGTGLIYYFGDYQPKLLHDQATATANAQASATTQAQAQATASAFAQASATANAQASATAIAQATANAQASATATALQSILTQATSGTPALNDPLNAPSNNNWDQLSSSQFKQGGSCGYINGAYHSQMPTKGFFQPCYARGAGPYTNFAYQVQMSIVSGDEGGILFRANPSTSQFYLFQVNTNGVYDLFLYIDTNGKNAKDLVSGTSSVFKTGLNQQNTITVVARGGTLYFYINGQYQNSASNNMFASGSIGVFGESATSSTDVAFNNAEVWQI